MQGGAPRSLGKLYFQHTVVVGIRTQRSEERSRKRQITVGLCDSRLIRERIHVVGRDVEDLIELSQCLRETMKGEIGICVLGEQPNVEWVEPLGFVKIRLAPVPLTLPPCNIGQGFRNPAAIRQEPTCLLKVTDCRVVILQTGVVVVAFRDERLAKVGLKSERGFGRLPRLVAEGDCGLKAL